MTITNETVFNEVIEKMLSNINVSRVESDAKMEAEGDIIYLSNGTNKRIFSSIPYSINNINIHGNRRNKLADEFCRLYKFSDIKNKHNQKQDELTKIIKLNYDYIVKKDVILDDVKELSEDVARLNQSVDLMFRQGYKDDEQRDLVDYFYLKRELLDIDYNIDDTQIVVSGGSTSYCNTRPYKHVGIKQLIQKRKELIKAAKEKGIRISYSRKTNKIINELKDVYEDDFKKSQELFNGIKERYEYIRDVRGIHLGTTHDYYLDETQKLKHKFESIGRETSISKISEIDNHIDRLTSDVEYSNKNSRMAMIYL